MGKIYTRFKELENQSPKDWFMDKIGLDEGIFRSIHKYDENCINVMSESRFKDL